MVAVTAGRGVADRRRDRLLQRDRGLPRDLRPAPGAGVDGGADAAGARRSRTSCPYRGAMPGAPRRDHAAARRLAGRDGGGASGRASGSTAGASAVRLARRSTSRPSCTGCAASSRRPRRRTARPAGGAASRSPGWRCCGWRRDRSTPPRRRSAARSTRRPDRATRVAAAGRLRRDHAGGRRRARRRAPAPTSCRGSPAELDAPLLRARGRPGRREPFCSPRATRRAALDALRRAWTAWRELERRTRPRASGC